ncbi:aspartate--tRNA ligase [Mycoplasma iguanae]|uniref:Aspartate--tRNA ligase n=1 Tax=Mycoplasma iguanae TaxID=292461 RepID=A0ABY5R927_9MOLU|nr:aspartate--tRNA ligase [Mycoplasma iguanae]UVD81470.1 aspartate--tRNA ligase [Mycoplasma iguanae]
MKKNKNNNLNISNINQEIELFGWVHNFRKFKNLIFVDLRDRSGIVQLVFQNIELDFGKEYVLKVQGKVVERKEKNLHLATGEIEILVSNYEILSQCNDLPFEIRDDINVNEDLRLEYRFLDLRRPKIMRNIILKNKVTNILRNFLDENDFLDIETPILSKSTPEGARDFLVTTRNAGHFFALPQSPQLFKQILMISGFEKYYQFARVFRDEDLRKDRQYEFTQLDIEVSFSSQKEIMEFMEKMYKHLFHKLNLSLGDKFPVMDFDEAIDKYGIDKPDIRHEHLLTEATTDLEDSTEFLFNFPSIKTIFLDQEISKKEFKIIAEEAKKNNAHHLLYLIIEDGKIVTSSFKIKSFMKLENYIKKQNYQTGTLFIVADQYENTTKALGAVRIKIKELFNLVDNNTFAFLWVVNWPMFEYDAETKKYTAMHHPFTMFQEGFLGTEKEKTPLLAKAQAYDLVLNGFELGGGSIRIFEKNVQQKMFEILGMSKEEQEKQFGFFLKAFEYGVPPHGGIAFGIDRLIMILNNVESIREVVPFPVNSKGINVMLNSPSAVSEQQLAEYFIKIDDKKA